MLFPKKFYKSLKYALRGLNYVFINEHSFRIQILSALLVLIAMIYFPLSIWERVILLMMISAVLILELINSIFERMADGMKPRLNPMVIDVKDIMAGAVLISAITSAVVALIIFWPYLALFLK